MNDSYFKVWEIAKQELYHFMKLYHISKIHYTFEDYFEHITRKYKIKILPHHFSDEAILGLTLIDKLGISFSYETESNPNRQNFTKCHELGHLVLQHSGTVFAENAQNQDWQEKEANYFSSFILMPDIILLTKIVYQQITFQDLARELKVSSQALEIRLEDFLFFRSHYPKEQIKEAIYHYKTRKSALLIQLMQSFKTKIIQEYEAITVKDIEYFKKYLTETDFITNQEIPALADPEFQTTIKEQFKQCRVSAYYDKGLTIWYSWNTQMLSDKDSRRKAKLKHYEIQNQGTSQ
ncbi:ImmA/IrrE family metallo-endopeptidase [Streptococcus constellatus]|uniref:ImmA/IrrE family metallo-endopeptidase n=1 Tax=Streptococcus constellatus TaxID=76860 RepID=UPI00189BF371|nr:ImmA/IrrE family metallo-endopeptidase [Streptococcus constellatus]